MKEFLEKQLQKRNAELEALKKRVEALEKINEESEDEAELKAAGEELDELKNKKAELEAELEEINAKIAELDKPADEEPKRTKLNFMKKEERGNKTMTLEERQERAKKFAETNTMTVETRSTLVSGGKVATPTEVDGIVDNWANVSSIVDLVKIENCEGMGSNKIAYVKDDASASTQTEGSAPSSSSEPTFDFVTISPTSKIIISYISKQVKKQSPLDYEGKIKEHARKALRKEIASLITTAVKGSTLATTVKATLASGKGVIDEKTLRNLVLAYGGSEGVEGNAVLFLNKTDLIAFGDVRGTNEKKAVYEIIPDTANPNVGIIKDGGLAVRYCINSNLTACAGTEQPASSGADIKTMFYGQPQNIELDLFSNYEIAVSEDYKFAENMLAIRGDVEAGAAVIKKDGVVFLTINKATA